MALGKQFLWLCCGLISMAFHRPGLGQQHGRSSLTPGLEEGVEEGIGFVILFFEKGRSVKVVLTILHTKPCGTTNLQNQRAAC